VTTPPSSETVDSQIQAMRPQLRKAVFLAPTGGGGLHAFSSRGRVTLEGADLARWVERLARFLDGTHSIAELTASLPADRRAKVEDIIRLLHRRGLLEDRAQESPRAVAPDAPAGQAAGIGYLGQFLDGPARGFERWHARKVLVLATGPVGPALVEAVARTGNEADLMQLTSGTAWDEIARGLTTLIAASDIVLHVCEPMDGAASRLVDTLCARHGAILARAIMTDDEAWIAPVLTPTAASLPWEGTWLRVSAHLASRTRAPGPREPAPTQPRDGANALVANLLTLRCWRHVTGVDAAPAATVMRLDLHELATSAHPTATHPLGLAAAPRTSAELSERIRALAAGGEVDEATFSRAASSLVDERLGILTSIDQRHFQQLPLWVAEARVSDPVGLLAARGCPGIVHGAGLDFPTARHRAARTGLELYASCMLDRRRLLATDGGPLPPDADSREGWLWASRLDGGENLLLPVEQVFARGPTPVPGPPVGVASAATWAAALQSGLLQQVEAVTIAEALASTAAIPRLDLEPTGYDAVTQHLLRLLRLGDAEIAIHDITGSLGVPTFTFCLGIRTVAHISDRLAEDALRLGLERLLLAHQAVTTNQLEYDPPPVADLPPGRRGAVTFTWAELEARSPHAQPPGDWLADLLDRLRQQGRVAVAVPLDHDPALAGALPYAVRVVLT
jgi:hypothetical protein